MVEYDIEYDIWGGVKSVKPKDEKKEEPKKPTKKKPKE